MLTGTVYRALQNEDGDPVDSDGNIVRLSGDGATKIGTVALIVGGTSGATRSVQGVNIRGDVVSTDGLLGFPADGPIQLQAGDVVEAAGQRWQCSGPILWGWGAHSLSGNPPRTRWISASAN